MLAVSLSVWWFLFQHWKYSLICLAFLVADLWKAPKGGKAIGTATGGSSEAIMLVGLALKKAWQERRKAAGKSYVLFSSLNNR